MNTVKHPHPTVKPTLTGSSGSGLVFAELRRSMISFKSCPMRFSCASRLSASWYLVTNSVPSAKSGAYGGKGGVWVNNIQLIMQHFPKHLQWSPTKDHPSELNQLLLKPCPLYFTAIELTIRDSSASGETINNNTAVTSTAAHLTDTDEHTALYKISKKCVKPQK